MPWSRMTSTAALEVGAIPKNWVRGLVYYSLIRDRCIDQPLTFASCGSNESCSSGWVGKFIDVTKAVLPWLWFTFGAISMFSKVDPAKISWICNLPTGNQKFILIDSVSKLFIKAIITVSSGAFKCLWVYGVLYCCPAFGSSADEMLPSLALTSFVVADKERFSRQIKVPINRMIGTYKTCFCVYTREAELNSPFVLIVFV